MGNRKRGTIQDKKKGNAGLKPGLYITAKNTKA
jgi:hypothetical protein